MWADKMLFSFGILVIISIGFSLFHNVGGGSPKCPNDESSAYEPRTCRDEPLDDRSGPDLSQTRFSDWPQGGELGNDIGDRCFQITRYEKDDEGQYLTNLISYEFRRKHPLSEDKVFCKRIKVRALRVQLFENIVGQNFAPQSDHEGANIGHCQGWYPKSFGTYVALSTVIRGDPDTRHPKIVEFNGSDCAPFCHTLRYGDVRLQYEMLVDLGSLRPRPPCRYAVYYGCVMEREQNCKFYYAEQTSH